MRSQVTVGVTTSLPASWRSEQWHFVSLRRLYRVGKRKTNALKVYLLALLVAACFAASYLVFFSGTVEQHILSTLPAQFTLHEAPSTPAPSAAASDPSCATNVQNTNATQFAQCPTFLQNFTRRNNSAVDTSLFNVANGNPGVNDELEAYTANADNLRIDSQSLVLEGRYASTGSAANSGYTSAKIDTLGKENFQYGKLVVRAMFPNGMGQWPAIWMLPADQKYANLSPDTDFSRYLNDGEIDIAELVGGDQHRIYGVAHSRAYPENGPDRSYYGTIIVPDSDTAFHDYELDWTPTSLTFRVDDHVYYSYDKKPGATYYTWPFDQHFYLIIDLALGGNWGGGNRAQYPPYGIDNSALPATLRVQSISYYPYIGK